MSVRERAQHGGSCIAQLHTHLPLHASQAALNLIHLVVPAHDVVKHCECAQLPHLCRQAAQPGAATVRRSAASTHMGASYVQAIMPSMHPSGHP